jgi:hypothetical protein
MTNLFTNGDFETGTTTGWDVVSLGEAYVPVVSTDVVRSGSYSCKLDCDDIIESETDGGFVYIKQTLDLTGVSKIYFSYNIPELTVDFGYAAEFGLLTSTGEAPEASFFATSATTSGWVDTYVNITEEWQIADVKVWLMSYFNPVG